MGEGNSQRATKGGEEVHPIGDAAQGEEGEQLPQQNVESVARRVGDAQDVGHELELGGVPRHHRRSHRADVEQKAAGEQRRGDYAHQLPL